MTAGDGKFTRHRLICAAKYETNSTRSCTYLPPGPAANNHPDLMRHETISGIPTHTRHDELALYLGTVCRDTVAVAGSYYLRFKIQNINRTLSRRTLSCLAVQVPVLWFGARSGWLPFWGGGLLG